MMSFDIVALNPSLEQMFYSYVNLDVPHYFFFILDWKTNRDDTEIWLALKENRIRGMMLIYKGRVVQLRAMKPAAQELFSRIDLKKIELNTEIEHRCIVRDKYRIVRENDLLLMTLGRGEERLAATDDVIELKPERAGEIAALMRSANPEFWGDMNAERIAASMNRNLWLGIIIDDRLVSVGNTFLTDIASNIHTVATDESYRNKGYATSVVSALVKEILQTNNLALIHVLKDNTSARRVYEKVGFKTYRNHLCGFAEL